MLFVNIFFIIFEIELHQVHLTSKLNIHFGQIFCILLYFINCYISTEYTVYSTLLPFIFYGWKLTGFANHLPVVTRTLPCNVLLTLHFDGSFPPQTHENLTLSQQNSIHFRIVSKWIFDADCDTCRQLISEIEYEWIRLRYFVL